jgi:polysaccharide biosynthesis transport protein
VRAGEPGYGYLLYNFLPILWRRRGTIWAAILVASAAAFLFYVAVGERYEAYTLIRVGQGIKEKAAGGSSPFGDGIDLTSRMDSLARIATTDHVIRQAALNTGVGRLFDSNEQSLLATFRRTISQYASEYASQFGFPIEHKKVREDDDLDQTALAALRDRIAARQEGRSDLLRISFRHSNPAAIADFVNGLTDSLVATHADLSQIRGADVFFDQQAKRLEQDAEKAAIDLRNFSIGASIYSAAEQRALLLKRASEVSALVATTRGSIEDREGQKQAIVDQLLVLKPVAQSRTVTGIVNRLGGREGKTTDANASTGAPVASGGTLSSFEESPPLLLVKVYQDAMAGLLKIHSDLSGSLRLQKMLEDELAAINTQLADLTSKEAEHDRLKRVLARASSAADVYGARVIEEKTSIDIAKKAQLSNVRVVQIAGVPTKPLLPHISHLIAFALIGGFALGAVGSMMLEVNAARPKTSEKTSDRKKRLELAKSDRRNQVTLVAAE